MEINKLINHIKTLAMQETDYDQFVLVFLFHARLIGMKLNGIKYFN